MHVREVDPGLDPRWDAYVSAHADAVAFHHSAWLRVLSAESGQQPLCLAVEDDAGTLRGVLPLMATRGLPLGLGGAAGARRVASLPRTPVAGPVADDADGTRLLIDGALERTPMGAQLQLKLPGPALDGIDDRLTGHPWRENFAIELPADAGEIRFGNSKQHSSVKASIRRAAKDGVTVRQAESVEDLRRWHRLYLETMRFHVVPARSRSFFDVLWDELAGRGMLRVFLTVRGDEILAGVVIVTDGSTAFYLFNGADRRLLHLRLNNVLQWEAIHALVGEGHRRYDLGEVVEGHEGLAQFKRKWGAQPQRLHRYYAPAPEAAPDPGDGPPSRVRDLLHRSWPRLPLPVTAAAGAVAYRYL